MSDAKKWYDVLESAHFAAEVGVVSTPAAMFVALRGHPAIAALIDQAGTAIGPVKARLVRMLTKATDERYCHPDDLAIAAYLTALSELRLQDALGVARVATTVKNLWWGAQVAHRIVESSKQAETIVIQFGAKQPAEEQNIQATSVNRTTVRKMAFRSRGPSLHVRPKRTLREAPIPHTVVMIEDLSAGDGFFSFGEANTPTLTVAQ
jgi:hypothetical protein